METIQEHDINVGNIFFGLYHQRFYGNKQYENDLIYREILDRIEIILKKQEIITEKWEDMSVELRKSYFKDNLKLNIRKTFFLVKKREEPSVFNKINYNTDFVFGYDAKDKQKSFVFRQFFALKISFTQIPVMYDFLNYQLKKNFKNDTEKYFDFLKDVLMEHHTLIDSGKIEKTKKYIALYVKSFPKKKKEKIKFYTWKGKYDLLKTVYRKLKENGCIEESTNVYSFLFVFSGKPASAEKKPIQWLKSNRLLAYLLFQLFKKEQIENKDWQSIAEKGNCFANKNGKQITANDLAQAASDFMKFQEKPQESELIDSILDF